MGKPQGEGVVVDAEKPNTRLPSCPCDPSIRLNPELSYEFSPENQSDSGSDSEADSSQPMHPVVPVIGQHLFKPLRHQQQLQGTAMAAVRKFISPPIFRCSPTEHARQWMILQEIGSCAQDSRMTLKTSQNTTGCWRKSGNAYSTRSTFDVFERFQPDNYGLRQESRLRSRTQGVNEPTTYLHWSGHIARNCLENPESEQFKGSPKDGAAGATSKGNLPINLAVADTLEEI
ncbi:hypothetical protein OUZ56_010417 [Daphnia magna]|uniref:Uncharacterized protein n=1 Tax=Daphnia magna TaxID=35525 RepID=A0ABR0AIQ1_9CRUS|nr:hypothetical protein OUZ56_010417 [Daphnia magna]